jgi:hypothetical protein
MMHSAGHVDWQAIGNISTAAGVVIALAGVTLTFVFTLRSQRLTREGQALEREQAETAAARSEAAAGLTEEYTRRVVEALETMARREGPAGDWPPPRRGARWSLTHHGGSTYLLSNDGDTAAQDVHVMAHETLTFVPPDPQAIEPGEAVTFMASQNLGTRDSTIRVRWTEEGAEDVKEWKYPLPPS